MTPFPRHHTSPTELPCTPRTQPVGRYAPSPTGRLHLGNLRTALLAEKDIRERGGLFLLRIEDTDLPRNRPGALESIIADLAWLGIRFDEGPHLPENGPAAPYLQSRRSSIYEAALRDLARRDLVYPCTCSRKDLQSAASAPHGPEGPVYSGRCGKLRQSWNIDEFLTQARRNPGKPLNASLRFRVSSMESFSVTEELHSRLVHPASEIGDFVVLRRDSLWAYQFVCAVDDAIMGVTRVVRGEDLLGSTPRQVAIINALGFTPPTYRHVPLMTNSAGERLSKRTDAASLDVLRTQGLSAEAIRATLLKQCSP